MTENHPWDLTCEHCGANIYVGSDSKDADREIERHRRECPRRKLTVEVPA